MYDLIVIGGGPGGYELAIQASKRFKVLLIEKEKIGGTCLNTGCIPTKALFHIAKDLKNLKTLEKKGIDLEVKNFNYQTFRDYKTGIINKLHDGMLFELKRKRIDIIYGEAKFTSENSLIVNGIEFQAKYIVIATGSKPIKLNLAGLNNQNVLYSNDLLNLNEIPKSLAVIGAGVIGIELASIYKEFGTEVTIIERLPRLLPSFDKEIAKRLESLLKSNGIKVLTNANLLEVVEEGKQLKVMHSNGEILAEKMLVAVGRVPNISGLDLDKAGIIYNKGIIVDENLETNIKNVFAIGDCNGRYQLAYTASFEAKRVINYIFKQEDKINFSLIPTCVFTFPEVAQVGLTEEDCEKQNLDYKINKFLFRANGKALTMDSEQGFIKIISSRNKIIGVHILGPLASELIHEANIALNCNMNVDHFLDIIHIHPTLSEIYLDALKN